MNRAEFIRELEYLLQDIPEEERDDAIAYYRDYLEEAGDEMEEQALREFGSPERVAAIIRSDLNGSFEDGGAFTEAGYQDERFREPNYGLAPRSELPEVVESDGMEAGGAFGEGTAQSGYGDAKAAAKRKRRQDLENRSIFKRILRAGLILILIGVAVPLTFGVGGTMLELLTTLFLLAVSSVLLVGVLTVAASVGGVGLLVFSVIMLAGSPPIGLVLLGMAVVILGMACIGVSLSLLIYGKWLPDGLRWCVNRISAVLHRERRRA